MTDSGQQPGNLVSFTMDPATGRVVKVETLDTNGGRHEVSDEEKASLARGGAGRLEEVLEEAFAAGIDCVLGEGHEPHDTRQSRQDAEIGHELLAPLIEHSSANRLLQREVLDRAILETLILHSMNPGPTPGSSPPENMQPDRSAPTRPN